MSDSPQHQTDAALRKLVTPYGLPKSLIGQQFFEHFLSQAVDGERKSDRPLHARELNVALGILHFHLGAEWYSKYIYTSERIPFLMNEVTSKPRATVYQRTAELGELILNLRPVRGLESVLQQLKVGQIESGLAELNVGRYLAFAGVPFRFVVPRGKRGDNYDVELKYPDGRAACADTKCKLEGAEYNIKSVENTLHDARTQLPNNKPGILFIKLPQHWLRAGVSHIVNDEPLCKELTDCCNRYFRSTERLVSVNFMTQVLEWRNEGPGQQEGLAQYEGGFELLNPAHRFDKTKDWALLQGRFNLFAPVGWRRLLSFFGS